jgi:RNA polymerase sigma factor (sigma-70 family)
MDGMPDATPIGGEALRASPAPLPAVPAQVPAPAPGPGAARTPTECPAEFARLVAEQRERVWRVVYRLLGWGDEVEDVVQEVFVAALRGAAGFRGEADARTWLTAIAIRKCRTHVRKRRLRQRLLGWLSHKPATSAAVSPAERHEEAERVRQAVRQLGVRDREVLVLRYLEQMSVKQMSTVLDLAVNAVEVRLTRARQRLKAVLQAQTGRAGVRE